MHEQQLRSFGARAETLVDIPEFEELDRRGGHLRLRRRLTVASALAVVLTVAGATVAQNTRPHADRSPVTPPPPPASVAGSPYPGATMTNLDQGRYWVQSCCVPGHRITDFAANPVAVFDVPKGWNAWVGPNRFDGHAPGRSNEEALGHSTWYVGALVLEIDAVNTHGCDRPDTGSLATAEDLVAALRRAFGFQVIQGPVPDQRFGYPATRLRVRGTKAIDGCPDSTAVFHSSEGMIGYFGSGDVADLWVVDVDGYPIFVQRAWSPNAPQGVRRQLDSIIDSIRFTFR